MLSRHFSMFCAAALLSCSVTFSERAEARPATVPTPGQGQTYFKPPPRLGEMSRLRPFYKKSIRSRSKAVPQPAQGSTVTLTRKIARKRTIDKAIPPGVMQRLGPRVRQVLNHLALSGKRGAATFDGDGTLWDGDVGEGFFQWMLKNNHYPAHRTPMLKWAWQGYKKGTYNGERFYELMVTSLAGIPETKVKRLAEKYFESHHRQRIYRPMSNLVEALHGLEIEPWVVSGSPKWVVAAGAKHVGIPEDRVIGLSVAVDKKGNLTDRVVRPVPWKAGKALRILQDVGKTPVLAAGNSHGDIQMLRIASEMPLVVNPGPRVHEHATFNGWTIHNYTRRDTWGHPPADNRGPNRPADVTAADRYPPAK